MFCKTGLTGRTSSENILTTQSYAYPNLWYGQQNSKITGTMVLFIAFGDLLLSLFDSYKTSGNAKVVFVVFFFSTRSPV